MDIEHLVAKYNKQLMEIDNFTHNCTLDIPTSALNEAADKLKSAVQDELISKCLTELLNSLCKFMSQTDVNIDPDKIVKGIYSQAKNLYHSYGFSDK